ncbi:beta-ACP synthase [Haloferula helveola]|uniref:Beta-ACP synthase n=1 Tax=Haloferula helveola TaxID=490095 RepID=A0ABN6HCP6_9BACT|nr:beta-ACP synthase [Haloferula helveola]
MSTTISGAGCLGALGNSLEDHLDSLRSGRPALRPLSELPDSPAGFDDLTAGWIRPRSLLVHRKWSPSSAAALHVAREAVNAAGWSSDDLAETAVFLGTSRGALAGWLEPWPGRRDFNLLAASNSLASEPAAAVSAELGIRGPWHVVSTGCCAGLDALATAELWIEAGRIERALVIAVDLPLVGPILDAYRRTGLLASGDGPGMRPAEGAAAVCIEKAGAQDLAQLLQCHSISDTEALVSSGRSPHALRKLLHSASTQHGVPALCVAHASGTEQNRSVEREAIESEFGASMPVVEFKSRTGHCIGSSGLLELALAQTGMTTPPLPPGSLVFKIASALGGKHTLAAISLPS